MTQPGDRFRVLIADSHALFREALRAVLDNEMDIQVVAEGRDGLHAVWEAERCTPDVAVLDANLANCDGIRATRLIKERLPSCRVLLLSAEQSQTVLAAAVEAGASGFLTKEVPLGELIAATRAVHRGETLVPRHMLGPLLESLLSRRKHQDHAVRRISKLTRREREVLALLSDGADNHVIAQQLVISPQTARTHIQNVLAKLGVHSRLEAASFVLQSGLRDHLVEPDSEPAIRHSLHMPAYGNHRKEYAPEVR